MDENSLRSSYRATASPCCSPTDASSTDILSGEEKVEEGRSSKSSRHQGEVSADLVSDLRWMVDGSPLKKFRRLSTSPILLSTSPILSGRAGRPCKRSRKLQKQFLKDFFGKQQILILIVLECDKMGTMETPAAPQGTTIGPKY